MNIHLCKSAHDGVVSVPKLKSEAGLELILYELPRGENQQCGFQTGPTQIGLYKHKRWVKTGNFGFRK